MKVNVVRGNKFFCMICGVESLCACENHGFMCILIDEDDYITPYRRFEWKNHENGFFWDPEKEDYKIVSGLFIDHFSFVALPTNWIGI